MTERVEAMTADSDREGHRLEWFRKRLAHGSADVDFAENERITGRGGLVLAWSGIRGVVTLAAAQTIEEQTPFRSTLVLVAVATLVIFGGTLPWLIGRVDFEEVSFADQRQELGRLMANLVDSVRDELGSFQDQEVDGERVHPAVAEALVQRFAPLLSGPGPVGVAPRPGVREQSTLLQRRCLDGLRTALLNERSIGALPLGDVHARGDDPRPRGDPLGRRSVAREASARHRPGVGQASARDTTDMTAYPIGVAQIAQHAEDLERASAFYTLLLGADPIGVFDPPGLVFFDLGGMRLLLELGAPSATSYSESPTCTPRWIGCARSVSPSKPSRT